MSAYTELLSHPAFDTRADHLNFPTRDQIRQVYERTRLICQKSGMHELASVRFFGLTVYRFNHRGYREAQTQVLGLSPPS